MKHYDLKRIYEWPFAVQAVMLGVCAFLVLYLAYLIDLSSLQSDIIINEQQVEDSKQQLQIMLNKEVDIKNEISQLPELKALLKQWQQQKFVDQPMLPNLLDTILKEGESNQLKFSAFNPMREVKEGDYTKVPVKIQMTGTFNAIATFISQVANMQKIILIEYFSIKNDGASAAATMSSLTSDDMLTADLTLEIYRK
jgi:type IV pilus assembly protein PilO